MSTTILQHLKGNPKIHSGVNYALQIMTRQSRTTHIKDVMTHIWPTKANEFPKRWKAEMTLHPGSDVQPNVSTSLVGLSTTPISYHTCNKFLPTSNESSTPGTIQNLKAPKKVAWVIDVETQKNKMNKPPQKHHPQKTSPPKSPGVSDFSHFFAW